MDKQDSLGFYGAVGNAYIQKSVVELATLGPRSSNTRYEVVRIEKAAVFVRISILHDDSDHMDLGVTEFPIDEILPDANAEKPPDDGATIADANLMIAGRSYLCRKVSTSETTIWLYGRVMVRLESPDVQTETVELSGPWAAS